MNNKSNLLLIFFLSLIAFYFSGFVGGYLMDEGRMGSELHSHSNAVNTWELSNEAPFKYRILFKKTVVQVETLLATTFDSSFYFAYILVSYSFFLATIIALYYYLRMNGFSNRLVLIGIVFFLTSPVILMAYKTPVHLREDYMAYFILLLGLIALHRNNTVLLLIIFILGPLCRETLLILPFTYLFFTNNDRIFKRILISTVPIFILIVVRYLIGIDTYDYFLGLRWNLANPMQILGFSTITFHATWILLVVYIFKRNSLINLTGYIDRSLFPVIGLVIATTFVGGIFNEIRLLFLAFPWVIIAVLKVIEQNKELGFTKWFAFIEIRNFLLCQPFIIYFLFTILNRVDNMSSLKERIPYDQWIIISILSLDLILFVLIHYLHNIRKIYKVQV